MKNAATLSPLMQELSAYIAGAVKRKLPDEVAERARLHLVDVVASMLSGSRQLPGMRAIAYIKPLGGTRQAGVIGTRIVTTTLNAVLANGTFGHADETDDTHPPTRSHPGTSVVPTVLALSEWLKLPGEHMLRAMVLGKARSRTLIAALFDIQKLENVGVLRKLYSA